MSGERLWGWWTEWKLELLRDYLSAFTTASKSVSETTYLDLFAGTPGSRSRETREPLQSGAEIALEVDPPFTHLRLFELTRADELAADLGSRFPGRDLEVIQGDCNEELRAILAKGDLPPWAPTFAFIDPDGPDCWWSTLRTIAEFKQSTSKYKVELWMLFPHASMTRLLKKTGTLRPDFADRITRVFGTDDWQRIYKERVRGRIRPRAARFEYVNLMRWRVERILGYTYTHAYTVRTSRGPLYDMIFATDHSAGHRIMGDTYRKFAARFPQMAQEAKQRRSAQGVLFTVAPESAEYRHEPPLAPYGSPERRRT
ncbi:MAG: three-Cys-motif partner protein TcmP [Acidimicrobiia bacterium]|nr:MAG: three-Cys-motif partner protein TcmP [Acidimicrobiia bacterium]